MDDRKLVVGTSVLGVFLAYVLLLTVVGGDEPTSLDRVAGPRSARVPAELREAELLRVERRARLTELPPAGAVVDPELVDYLAPAIEDLLADDDWESLDDRWAYPTRGALEEWVGGRIGGVYDAVRDNGEGILAKYGWDREWPPAEGRPTPQDYDRLYAAGEGYFSRALEYENHQRLVYELLGSVVLPPERRRGLLDLAESYDELTERSWRLVFEGDPYPFDLMELGHRMGLD